MDPINQVFESEPSITKTIHLQMEQKTLEHEHTLEDRKQEREWKSCCLTLDKQATLFFSRLLLTLILIGFCIAQLAVEPESQIYLPPHIRYWSLPSYSNSGEGWSRLSYSLNSQLT